MKWRLVNFNYVEGKIKMMYVIISNCVDDVGRYSYIKKLRYFILIDLYGCCGNLICLRNSFCF